MRKFGLVHTEIMFLLTFFREFRYLIKKRKNPSSARNESRKHNRMAFELT